MSQHVPTLSFRDLALTPPLLEALANLGHELPTAIQELAIPPLLDGADVLGQAETGTGKTAAFALPLLARIDLALRAPQVLVLAPTRELALQVAGAFQQYGSKLRGLSVLPVYGGAEYEPQLRKLRQGVQVVVGTPGRLMDLMRREALSLSQLSAMVIDEADEMLRMGFIDDVEWILKEAPATRQTALFSATMPPQIRKIAKTHMRDPQEIVARSGTAAAVSITQRYCLVAQAHKIEALSRILEVSPSGGSIVFMRTKQATLELADELSSRGFRASALNGDVAQRERERTIERLKSGQVDVLVATDVAARGLDVDRVCRVFNYDLPNDPESYVHRIGRTGRAGRQGEAILFVGPRDLRALKTLEKITGQPIEKLDVPSGAALSGHRKARFKARIKDSLDSVSMDFFRELLREYQAENGTDPIDIAAALAGLLQGDAPLVAPDMPRHEPANAGKRREGPFVTNRRRSATAPEPGLERFRVSVGRAHGVKPGNLVGAIANEAGLPSALIGRIEICDDYSTVELPEGIPSGVFRRLKRAWVCNRQLDISRVTVA